jgi:DNA-binding XRE family transcriptional regulator
LVVPDPAGVTRAVRLGIALDGIVPVRAQQGLVLRCAREARGMTQDDVARIAGCSRATVQRIEAGDQPPGGRIGELLTAVGVPHADLR